MNTLKKYILFAAMFFCASSFANTYTSDLSDLWWNEKEAGWGVNVNHQREIVFLTFFVYGADGRGTWYTGQASLTGQDSRGANIFTGGMYTFSGPTDGTPFNPANVVSRNAGTVTFTAFLDNATLTYTINGVAVDKVVTRQTFRNNDLSGGYVGAIKEIKYGCQSPTSNGESNSNVEFNVTNTATTFSMTARKLDGSVCSYTGNYVQNGRLGRSQGTYSCPAGVTGTYDAFELEGNMQGMLGRYFTNGSVCDSSGRFAAMRK